MPTEPKLNNLTTQSTATSAIENEIAAYRAISPGAIFALICGILAILSFVSWWFLTFAVLALVVGYLSDRKILNMSDTLTGRSMAQAGMGLGIVFGLTALSTTVVQDMIRVKQAKSFALSYEDVLRKGTVDLLVWYSQPAVAREHTSPEDLMKEMTKQGPGAAAFEEKYGGLREIRKALDEPGSDIHFQSIEGHGDLDLTSWAGAVYEIHRPKADEPADREQLGLALLKGEKSKNGKMDWWVENFKYPYKAKTLVPPAPAHKADDGHGH